MKVNSKVFKSKNFFYTSEDDNQNIDLKDFKDIKVRTYNIPHTFYNISPSFDNIIVNGINYQITLYQLYSITELLDALVLLVPDISSYSINSSKYKVTLNFVPNATITGGYLSKVLGFESFDVAVPSKEADHVYNLNYRFRHGIYITSNNVSNTYHRNNVNVISQIPLIAPFGSSISSFLTNFEDNNFITLDDEYLNLNINVVDSDFKDIDFNGYEYAIEFTCRSKKF